MQSVYLNNLPDQERFDLHHIPEPNSGCWLWADAVNPDGYGRMKAGGKTMGAHRASWFLHRGIIPAGLSVLHKCDVRCCVNPDHLYIGTQRDNMTDRVKRNRWDGFCRGERHAYAKLSEHQALEILNMAGTCRALAQRYGVCASTISQIKTGKRWAHLSKEKAQ